MNLLKEAVKHNCYDYYHLMVGVEFPLKSQDYIHDFFSANNGKEFIGFSNSKNFSYRLKYYRPWGKYERSNSKIEKCLYKLDVKLLRLQEKISYSRLKHEDSFYKKGYANWSITQALAQYILTFENEIKHSCKWTVCADEVFLHTIVYHSKFYKNVYNVEDEYKSAMRLTTWKDPKNQFHMKDLPELYTSSMLFARKFDDNDAVEIIKCLLKNRNNDI